VTLGVFGDVETTAGVGATMGPGVITDVAAGVVATVIEGGDKSVTGVLLGAMMG
jgi:hypothetical protein